MNDRQSVLVRVPHIDAHQFGWRGIRQSDSDAEAGCQEVAIGLPASGISARGEGVELTGEGCDQVLFELRGGLAIGRGGMVVVEGPEIFGLFRSLLALPGGLGVVDPQEPVGHKRIDGVAARLVVVMREREDVGTHAFGNADEIIDAPDGRQDLGWSC